MDIAHRQSHNPLNTTTSDTCTQSCNVGVNAMDTHNPVDLSTMEPHLPAPPSAMALPCPANPSTMVLPHLAHPTATTSDTCTLSCIVSVNATDIQNPVNMSTMEPNLPAPPSTQALLCPDTLRTMVLTSLPITTTFWPPAPSDLIQAVTQALAWTPADRTAPIFDFHMSPEAAQHNLHILQENNWDLQQILLHDHHSPLHPGSEFRPTSLLEKIFIGHPLWPQFHQTLHQGATLPLTPLEESACLANLREAVTYGNHKSAIRNAPRLMKILSTEVNKAWQLPLPIQHLDKIPGAIVSPLGLAEQAGIDENGHIIPKWRVTHDQSFAFSSGQSINDRVIESELTPCQYGFALRRFLHTII